MHRRGRKSYHVDDDPPNPKSQGQKHMGQRGATVQQQTGSSVVITNDSCWDCRWGCYTAFAADCLRVVDHAVKTVTGQEGIFSNVVC